MPTNAIINPVLRRALLRHHNLTLPNDPDDDPPSLAALLACVQPLQTDSRFSLNSSLVLGLFSFSRLVMVDDLERNEGLILSHPLLGALVGQHAVPDTPEFVSPDRLDEHYAHNRPFSVIDADSSQQTAIEAVKSGASLVVQGPPGTGKSQTITNIIAELLAAGKKVLFVSAKRAALDVVLQRMADIGLDGLCLPVHDAVDKKAVIDDLYRTCEVARQSQGSTRLNEGQDARLQHCRATLNEHVRLMHTLDEGMRMTAYDAYGRLSALRDTPLIKPVVREPGLFVQESIGRISDLLDHLTAFSDLLLGRTVSLWHQSTITHPLNYQERMVIVSHLTTIETSCATLERMTREMARIAGANVSSIQVSTVQWVCGLVDAALDGPGLEQALLAGDVMIRNDVFKRVDRELDAYRTEREELLGTFDEAIFNLPLDDLQARLDGPYASGFKRLFSHAYRRDRADLEALHRQGDASGKLDYTRLRTTVGVARRAIQRRVALDGDATATTLLGSHYRGADTDKDLLKRALDQNAWYAVLCQSARGQAALTPLPPNQMDELARLCDEARAGLQPMETSLSEIRRLFPVTVLQDWGDDPVLDHTGMTAKLLADEVPHLVTWLDFKQAQRSIADAGFPDLVATLQASRLPLSDWIAAFRHGMLRAWVDYYHDQHPALGHFSQVSHGKVRDEFSHLDRESFAQNQQAVRSAHTRGIQRFLYTDRQQHARLAREATKKRQVWPVRKLMTEIPELLLQVKPCWMMSPLSVTQMVEATRTRFDVVIFDEASQIKMEEGVCAMLRAQQVVVVGDDKQLPPTSFFSQTTLDDESDDADEASFESILDRCAGLLQPFTLRWHYRSKDESLIAFSNLTYYHNDLITFPNAERRPDWGVRLHFVPNGVYDRGGARTNVREAAVVARMILDHYRTGRPESLGVIALSQAQQEAIREAFDALLAQYPGVNVPENGSNGLFIKNLENVQGDERDAIILSIGYARDAGGVLSHNFGPLNRQGGERRLNVAITRARQSLTVVSSIHSTDLDTSRSKADAVAQLRDYLAYAETGVLPQATATTITGDAGTALEDDIRQRLEERGYRVETSVGYSDQRIELAIVDPAQPNRYLLGVECDGLVYRAASTARDRDRLRDAILEGLGWTMHRIWGREWFRDSDAELVRLYDRLQHRAAPPVVPAAKAPLCARCGNPLSPTAHFCGNCGSPAGIPVRPLVPPIQSQGPGPTGTQIVTSLPPVAPPPSTTHSVTLSGPLAAGVMLNGRYRIVQVLGTGAFGRVYRAEDTLDPTSPPLAIKELMDDQFTTPTEKQDAIRWFRREVSNLLNIEHPSIPTVHAYWTATVTSGPFYLAMDLVVGKTLEQTQRDNGPINWRQAAEWGMAIGKALAYLHSQMPPFIFRDLKPPNIMIETGTNTPKLIDFGIARQFTAQIGQTAIGTPGYIPMEQWLGKTEPRSDLYALGATVHSLVSGRTPEAEFARLQGKGLDVEGSLRLLFPPLGTIVTGLPPDFAAAIAKAVAFDVNDRYPDVVTFGIALGQSLGLTPADAAIAMRP